MDQSVPDVKPRKSSGDGGGYDFEHPVIAVRVDRAFKEMVEAYRKRTGKSLKDILEAGMAAERPLMEGSYYKDEDVEQLYKEGRKHGFKEGYELAERWFKVRAPCSICGDLITLQGEDMIAQVREALANAGFAHLRCQRRPGDPRWQGRS